MSILSSPLHTGHAFPYGAVLTDNGVNFAVFSRSAKAMRVLLYDSVDDADPADIVDFDPREGRYGDIWHAFVPFLAAGQLYHLQADGPYDPARGQRFDGKARLIDPYAKALAGDFLPAEDGILRPPKCVVVDEEFDWQGDRPLRRNLSESVIYEMHVRGFTQSPNSGVAAPGTYLGVIEKIPYLKSLGVTAVELMPVHEFPIKNCDGSTPTRPNYWGYDPLAFFAPHRGYAAGSEPGAQVREFKLMVRELHKAGIEVILDVVFNHTAEGDHRGPTLSFKGLENQVYYYLANHGAHYCNYSGCGNAVNGNHPVVREMIFQCLKHWVLNYHIDGFRFDLASILSRDRYGRLAANPPLVETIAEDPLLADTKIIAEAWDAAGSYQVGTFSHLRWAEWNGRYRDDVRRFWRGDHHLLGGLATRLAGSSDLYQSSCRQPYHGINFITAHDGFSMNDLVSYQHKHNHANGEENRDGEHHNNSLNFGVEGPTDDPHVERERLKQIKNLLATLFLSQGVPMLLSGDECRRTQKGNNNTYCQDNELSWFDWKLVEKHADLVRFCRELIAFRRAEPTVRRTEFLSGRSAEPDCCGSSAGVERISNPFHLPDVSWFGPDGKPVDWGHNHHSLMCLLAGTPASAYDEVGRDVLILIHAGHEAQTFHLPAGIPRKYWRLFADTAAHSPNDIYPNGDGPLPESRWLTLPARSLRCYVSHHSPV